MAIRSFANAMVEEFFRTGRVTKGMGWSGVSKVALHKLDMLQYAHEVSELKSPPGNRLEALKGNLKDFYSIRNNDKWRVIFRWGDSGPLDIDIVDYH